MKFSKDYLRQTIYACWIGKNIGGTIGTPFEGTKEILNIHGFNSEPGAPLPNDDLDLQLAWLRCVDELGPENVNSKTLGEYWLAYVKPHWNEYGVGKGNMRAGIMPPLSGEMFNEHWRDSNGAWIRTEIWACLYPGQVEKAIRYAFEDASVDHGFGEGTYAAIFVEALESAAFVIKDLRILLSIALSKIPEDCRVAKAVRLTIDCYDKGIDWKETRRLLVEQSSDIGWFQAPANVAYCILGLLYGNCDFKQSVLIAVDCGDDTDCTGGTVGAFLGILKGKDGIPEDWKAYVGDEIKSICLLNGHGRFPQSNEELTQNIMNLLPVTLRTGMQKLCFGEEVELCDKNDFSEIVPEKFMGTEFIDAYLSRGRCSFSIEGLFTDVVISYQEEPVISVEKMISGVIQLQPHTLPGAKMVCLKWYLPDGWTACSRQTAFIPSTYQNMTAIEKQHTLIPFTITAGERVEPINTVILDVYMADHPVHITVPMTILG